MYFLLYIHFFESVDISSFIDVSRVLTWNLNFKAVKLLIIAYEKHMLHGFGYAYIVWLLRNLYFMCTERHISHGY